MPSLRPRLALVLVTLVLGLLVAACDDAGPAPPAGSPGPPAAAFVGPLWSTISVRGQPPVPGSEPTITFARERLQGTGGCNQLSGRYRYDEASGTIAFEDLAMTAMACVDNRTMAFESAFAQALTQATRVDRDADGRLHLSGPGGEIVLAATIEG
jgi:heat shock protein HslJ